MVEGGLTWFNYFPLLVYLTMKPLVPMHLKYNPPSHNTNINSVTFFGTNSFDTLPQVEQEQELRMGLGGAHSN